MGEVQITKEMVFTSGPLELWTQRPPTDGERKILDRALTLWDVAMHGLLKIFDKRYKNPAKQYLIRYTATYTEYLYSVFELMAAVHSRQKMLDAPIPFNSAAEWFQMWFLELKYQLVSQVLYYPQAEDKKQSIKALRQATKALRSLNEEDNPVPRNYKATHLLIKSAMTIAGNDVRFLNTHYRRMIKARQEMIDFMEKNGKLAQHEGDEAFLVINGRRRKRMPPSGRSTVEFVGSKKAVCRTLTG